MKKVARPKGVSVSELNIRKAALRLLGQKLVSPEVQYIQRTLGASAPQEEIDRNVVAVRTLPWASIVLPD
jgi:hypothetical protein